MATKPSTAGVGQLVFPGDESYKEEVPSSGCAILSLLLPTRFPKELKEPKPRKPLTNKEIKVEAARLLTEEITALQTELKDVRGDNVVLHGKLDTYALSNEKLLERVSDGEGKQLIVKGMVDSYEQALEVLCGRQSLSEETVEKLSGQLLKSQETEVNLQGMLGCCEGTVLSLQSLLDRCTDTVTTLRKKSQTSERDARELHSRVDTSEQKQEALCAQVDAYAGNDLALRSKLNSCERSNIEIRNRLKQSETDRLARQASFTAYKEKMEGVLVVSNKKYLDLAGAVTELGASFLCKTDKLAGCQIALDNKHELCTSLSRKVDEVMTRLNIFDMGRDVQAVLSGKVDELMTRSSKVDLGRELLRIGALEAEAVAQHTWLEQLDTGLTNVEEEVVDFASKISSTKCAWETRFVAFGNSVAETGLTLRGDIAELRECTADSVNAIGSKVHTFHRRIGERPSSSAPPSPALRFSNPTAVRV